MMASRMGKTGRGLRFGFNPQATPGLLLIALLSLAGLFWRFGLARQPGEYCVRQGNYHLEDNRNEAAEREFSRALEEDPANATAYLGLGIAALNSGLEDKAAAMFEKAISLDEKLAAAHANLGIAHDRAGRHEMALASYARALALDPATGDGPGFVWRLLHNVAEKPANIAERARYLAAELKKPAREQLLQVPELDAKERRSFSR